MTPERRAIKERLGKALAKAAEVGITQSTIAEDFDLTASAVGQWWSFRGKASLPTPDKWPKLARLLKVNLSWLLSGEGDREEIAVNNSELALIRRYRQLSDHQRSILSGYIDGMLAGDVSPAASFMAGKRR